MNRRSATPNSKSEALEERKSRSKSSSKPTSRSSSRSPAPKERRKSSATATPVKGRAARASSATSTPKKKKKEPEPEPEEVSESEEEELDEEEAGSELEESADAVDTEEIVAQRRQRQAQIMKEKNMESRRLEREEASGMLAVGHINHGHAMMFSTIVIAVAYVLAAGVYQTDILGMPQSQAALRPNVAASQPPLQQQPIQSQALPTAASPSPFGAPAAANPFGGAAAASPFGSANAGPLLSSNFVQAPLDTSVWLKTEAKPGPPYQCSFADKAVLSNANQPLMTGSFADQYACYSGEIKSLQPLAAKCFTAVFKPAKVAGVVSSFMIQNVASGRNEISLQFRGVDGRQLHIMSWSGDQLVATHAIPLDFDATAADHTYSIQRAPTGVQVLIDGVPKWQAAPTQAPADSMPMHALANTWAVDASGHQVAGQFTGQEPAVTFWTSISAGQSC